MGKWAIAVRTVFARREWLWAPVYYAVIVLWIYRALWHQNGADYALGWDVVDQYGPDLDFQAAELGAGHFSLWNPYDRGGYPLIADPSLDRYYPAGWPFVAGSTVLGSPWWMIQVKVLAHHVLAAGAMHLFLRHRGLPRSAALIAGTALVASAPMLVHKASNILWPMAWAPLAWIAVDRLCAAPNCRRSALVAASIMVPATAGAPPGFFYTLLLVASYGGWRVAATVAAAPPTQRRKIAASLGMWFGAAGVVVAVGTAITIIPASELVPLSERAAKAGSGFSLEGSEPAIATLAGIVAPTVGKLGSYVGALALLLGLFGLIAPRSHAGVARWGFAVAALATLATFGAQTPILPWLSEYVPGFDRFRVPGRYRLVALWAFTPLIAIGWSALVDRSRGVPWKRLVAVAALIWLSCALLVYTRDAVAFPPGPRAQWWPIAVAGAACAVALAAARMRTAFGAHIAALAIVLVVCDAPLFWHTPRHPPPGDPRRTHPGEESALAPLGDVAVSYRIFDEFSFADRVGHRRQIRDFRGYPAIDQVALSRYVDVLRFAEKSPAILEAYNVRWILGGLHYRFGKSAHLVPSPSRDGHFVLRGFPGADPRLAHTFEAKHPAPLVAWYGAIRIVDHDVLGAVLASEETDGQRRLAVIEATDASSVAVDLAGLQAAAAAPPPSQTGTVIRYEPDAIDVRITAPAAGMVVLNEMSYPGWRATVDGQPVPPLRANYLLRAAIVGPGEHVIRWRFEPRHWPPLVVGYLLAIALLLAAWLWPRSS